MEKLGVVSTIWAKCLSAGDRFEDLVLRFGKEGFLDIEIRDGDYLRNSENPLQEAKMSRDYLLGLAEA